MRIGIDARMLGSAPGIGRYIDCLTSELFRIDTESEYVLFLREPVFTQYTLPRGRIKKVRVPERWYGFAEQVTLPIRFARERLDLLFVPQFNVPLFVPCPFIVTIHDVTQLFMPGPLRAHSRMRERAFRLVFSRAVRRARAVIAVSHYTKEEVLKNFGGDPKKIHVIYEGPGLAPPAREALISNLEFLNNLKSQNPKIRIGGLEVRDSNLEIPNSEYLLAVGVWRPHKNFTGLLEAFAILRRTPVLSSLKLVLVGEEDSRYPEVRERISALGLSDTVVAPGSINDADLASCYRGARAVVIPSLYEGFGFVGLEALRFGVPIAAARAAALPEILGDAAAYFDPRDPKAMADQIKRVLVDERERQRILMAAPAVLMRYSWEKAARETLNVFMEHKS